MSTDLPRRVAAGNRRLLAELAAGTALSTAVGVAAWVQGRRRGLPFVTSFGRQTVAWAAVDAAIVAVGALRSSVPADDVAARAAARRLRRVTGVNGVLDVGYLAGAGVLGSRFPARRGDAVAVAVQGAFLLWLDVRHTRRFHALARRP